MDDDATETKRRPRKEKSLLARALGYLARREHSRAELARKLAPHADSTDQLQRLLGELEAKKLLSDRRFTEVLARSRGERFGAARVRQELRAHGISDSLVRDAVGELARTELQRARSLAAQVRRAPRGRGRKGAPDAVSRAARIQQRRHPPRCRWTRRGLIACPLYTAALRTARCSGRRFTRGAWIRLLWLSVPPTSV